MSTIEWTTLLPSMPFKAIIERHDICQVANHFLTAGASLHLLLNNPSYSSEEAIVESTWPLEQLGIEDTNDIECARKIVIELAETFLDIMGSYYNRYTHTYRVSAVLFNERTISIEGTSLKQKDI